MKTKLILTQDYLLLIDEKAEIKKGDLALLPSYVGIVIVGDIDDMPYKTLHRNWMGLFCDTCFDVEEISKFQKIVAYYPLTKEAKELDLPLLPPFEVNIEKLACEKYSIKEGLNDYNERYYNSHNVAKAEAFIDGYKAAQSKQFSLEDIKKAIKIAQTPIEAGIENYYPNVNEVLEQLSTQQLPSEFIPEYEYYYHSSMEFYADAGFIKCSKEQYKTIKKEIPTCPVKLEIKTITNSEGKSEAVGMYKY